jgi:hypothetical protein
MKFKHKISLKVVAAGILAAFTVLLTCQARADLGDTYAQSCRRYGCRGTVSGNEMRWAIEGNNLIVQEVFYRNQCVAIQYTPSHGRHLIESAIWGLLQRNVRSGDHWHTYDNDSYGQPEYTNDGNDILGKLLTSDSGQLRIAYRSWLNRHGMMNESPSNGGGDDGGSYGRAPVDESGAV